MKFCSKCGAQLQDGAKFCPSCGNTVNAKSTANSSSAFQNLMNTPDTTAQYDAQDVAQSKVMSILAYIGPCIIVPFLKARNSKYTRYHMNQAISLSVFSAAFSLVHSILQWILDLIFIESESAYGITMSHNIAQVPYTILSILISLPAILIIAYIVLGIVNVASGKAKELPIIGRFSLLNK